MILNASLSEITIVELLVNLADYLVTAEVWVLVRTFPVSRLRFIRVFPEEPKEFPQEILLRKVSSLSAGYR